MTILEHPGMDRILQKKPHTTLAIKEPSCDLGRTLAQKFLIDTHQTKNFNGSRANSRRAERTVPILRLERRGDLCPLEIRAERGSIEGTKHPPESEKPRNSDQLVAVMMRAAHGEQSGST